MATEPAPQVAVAVTSESLVAIIAGEGRLPVDVAAHLHQAGIRILLVLCGRPEQTAPELLAFDHLRVELEDALGVVPMLRKRGVTHAVLAGAIVRRPRWAALRPKWRLLSLALSALRSLRRGDDGLLRYVVRYFEENGIRIIGAHELVPDLLASEGVLTIQKPNAADRRDIDAALRAARALGMLDIGQGAIAIGGRVIALEGIEGTDGLLERTRDLRSHGRLAHAKRGVLVKCSKPQQELRADLPTIGPDTVAKAAAAGLAGIAVEAGRSLMLQREQTLREAARLGLFIVGLEAAK